MKNFSLLITILFLISFNGNSQNCKYEINKIDEFTKQVTKQTKDKIIALIVKGGIQVNASTYRSGDESLFQLSYFDRVKKNEKALISIPEEAELSLLLTNDEIVKLKCKEETIAYIKHYKVLFANEYELRLESIPYSLSSEDLSQLSNTLVKTLRMTYTNKNKRSQTFDIELSDKNARQLKELVMCVL